MVEFSSGGWTVKSRLKELVARKEQESGVRIQQKEIAEATGLDDNTISRWMSPKAFTKLDVKPLERLCRYLGCEIGDLLYLDKSPN